MTTRSRLPNLALVTNTGMLLTLLGCNPSQTPNDAGDVNTSDAGPMNVVFNEAAGTGADFVELYNASNQPFDFSGLGVTDSEAGAPKLSAVFRFPSGTVIAPGGFLVVMMESNCPAGLANCFRSEAGISQGNGETVWLLAADNAVMARVDYPANAAAAGRSWARVPDGTGAFVDAQRTPGAQNQR